VQRGKKWLVRRQGRESMRQQRGRESIRKRYRERREKETIMN
jgi:hypothetical protein